MSLTKQDLKSIKTVVSEIVSKEINVLAVITNNSFMAVDQRFEKMDQRFEKMDQRFEKMDQRFEKMDQRFDKIDQRLDGHDSRFEKIEGQLNYQNQKIDRNHLELSGKIDRVVTMLTDDMQPIYDDVTNLKRRVTKLENARA